MNQGIVELREKMKDLDFNGPGVLDIQGIMERLPHRPPFLLLDKVFYLEKERAIGVKSVTMNEPFFLGHFPGDPVMPGVLIIEAMAQLGALAYFEELGEEAPNYAVYFSKIEQAKFRAKVVPGDRLVFIASNSSSKGSFRNMVGETYVGEKLVASAEMMAALVKKESQGKS